MKDMIQYNPRNLITHYIRDDRGAPRGVAIAVRIGDEVYYGFSLCNVNADKFNKKKGIQIALRRAMSPSYLLPSVEDRQAAVLDAYDHLKNRAVRYFKDLPPDVVLFGYEANSEI